MTVRFSLPTAYAGCQSGTVPYIGQRVGQGATRCLYHVGRPALYLWLPLSAPCNLTGPALHQEDRTASSCSACGSREPLGGGLLIWAAGQQCKKSVPCCCNDCLRVTKPVFPELPPCCCSLQSGFCLSHLGEGVGRRG